MALEYGATPWGKWFVEALGTYGIGERLKRGKIYANTGKVRTLTVQDRRVIAKVKGRSSPYYTVEIVFPIISQQEQSELYEIISDDPLLLSRIQAGELPIDLLSAFKKRNIWLIPKHWRDMKRSCTCPDWGDPCKHMAAVYYVLARQIDADPHLVFKLRGVDLASHFGEAMTHELEPPFSVVLEPEVTSPRSIPEEAPASPPAGNYLHFIQSLLSAKQAFSDRDFSIPLIGLYHQAARNPIEGIMVTVNESLEHAFAHARWSVQASALEPGCSIRLRYSLPSGKEGTLDLSEAAPLFLSFGNDRGVAEYRFFFYFYRLINFLWNSAAFVPTPAWEKDSILTIFWKPLDTLPVIQQVLDNLAKYDPGLLRSGGKNGALVQGRSTVDLFACVLLTGLVHSLDYTPSGGSEAYQDLVALFFKGKSLRVASPKYRSLPLAIDAWLSALRTDFTAWRYRCTLTAVPSSRYSVTGLPVGYRLAFDVVLPETVVPLKKALEHTGHRDVLRVPTALSVYLPEILSLAKKKSVILSEDRLTLFLNEASFLLARLGIQVVLPKELHRELKPRLVLRDSNGVNVALVSYLNLASLVTYEWSIALGDQILSVQEFEALVAKKHSLVRFKDGFVQLDADEIAELLKRAKKTKEITAVEVLKAHFAGETHFSPPLNKSIDTLLQKKEYPPPKGLQAQLRPYQLRGYNWVCSLLMGGFGCILADDMGLGKTIQAIAVLLQFEERELLGDGGALVVAPAALLSNWERELSRFAPSLTAGRFHGTGRSLASNSRVVLTTYQTAVRDGTKLKNRHFSLLIADEAHIMKNADTAVSRTIKSLQIPYRLALSGTPVENRLEDLRSLFDFILPGYLGGPETFKREYRKPIEVNRDRSRAEKLRAITFPFLLRRLKTDKSVISDLPDKVTINEYANLGAEQAALYESVVRNVLAKSEQITEKAQRSALILQLLTSLKQICDHPRCYDKESPPQADLSGKALLLLALLEEILKGDEKVLVFSQYVQTLEILKTVIQNELEETVDVYHGGLSQKKRDQVVHDFQTNPLARIMLVSLKAGGLGLNLTAARRVIHYDLWFNPAVENQATDRAFRIGQRSTVFVHRFITQNTFEEKIDAMLKSKRELAEMTVASGESWLARMSHKELTDLFS